MGFVGVILVFNYEISVGAILIFNDDKSFSWKSAAASPFPPPFRRSVSISSLTIFSRPGNLI